MQSANLLLESGNTLTVVGEHADFGDGKVKGSGALFDNLDVEYDRLLVARDDQLYFHSSNHQGKLSFSVGGFTRSDLILLDVSTPSSPVILNSQVVPDGEGFRLDFADEVSGEPHKYAALSLDGLEGLPEMRELPPDLASAGYIGAGSARDLIEAGRGSDYIMITHPDLAAPFQRLADHRAALGHRPFMCSIFEIYDQFSGGIKDPEAIHRFLRTAFAEWEEPPLYLLLAADACEDYRHDNPQASPDWIPTMMHVASVVNGSIPDLSGTDPWFGQRLESRGRYSQSDAGHVRRQDAYQLHRPSRHYDRQDYSL